MNWQDEESFKRKSHPIVTISRLIAGRALGTGNRPGQLSDPVFLMRLDEIS